MFFIDPLFLLFMAPALLFSALAQYKVSSAFKKYSKIANSRRMSGAEAASLVMNSAGVFDVKIEQTGGWLSDHYDPTSKTLRLSAENYSTCNWVFIPKGSNRISPRCCIWVANVVVYYFWRVVFILIQSCRLRRCTLWCGGIISIHHTSCRNKRIISCKKHII